MPASFALRPAVSDDRAALSTFVPDAERAALDRMIEDGRCFVAMHEGRPVLALAWPAEGDGPMLLADPDASPEALAGLQAWLGWYARTAFALGAPAAGHAAGPVAA
jgi:hypothetical protein